MDGVEQEPQPRVAGSPPSSQLKRGLCRLVSLPSKSEYSGRALGEECAYTRYSEPHTLVEMQGNCFMPF